MPYRRRRSYRRRKQNTVWLPDSASISVAIGSGGTEHGWLGAAFVPGEQTGSNNLPINADTVLERVRGEMMFIPSRQGGAFYWLALVQGPRNLITSNADDAPELHTNTEGDNFPVYMACVSESGETKVDMIDSKSKRRVPFGNALRWVYRIANISSASISFSIALNARLLFKIP